MSLRSGAPAALAAIHLAGLAVVAALPDPVAQFPRFAVGTLLATVAWLAFSLYLLRSERRAPADETRANAVSATSPSWIVAACAAAIGGRLLLLVPETPLSDDLYRYLWDGHVAHAGIDPYLHAPASPALDAVRTELAARVNHADVPTIYPPVAQAYFRLLDRYGADPRGVRAAAAGFDLAAALVMAGVLRRSGRSPALACIHAACPLAILETAGGGHVDALGMLLVTGALWAADPAASRWRSLAGGALLGGAALVKIVPAALVPSFFARRPRAATLAFIAGAALAGLAILPYARTGHHWLDGLATYAKHWHFNDLFFSIGVGAGLASDTVRLALAGAFAAVALAVPWLVKERAACAGTVLGAFLLLSPTVHPWYALWLVPFLAVLPRALRPAGFALVALLPLSYVTPWIERSTGVWHDTPWSRALVWLPVIVLLGFGAARAARESRRAVNLSLESTESPLRARS